VGVPEAYNQIFNVGADTPYAVAELAEVVQEAMGRRTGIRRLEARKEVLHAHSDHSKAARILNCTPCVGLREGVGRMAEWAWKTGPRASACFENIEVERNLPGGWA
jgi:UDP-glucose 4-epimerase